MYIVGTIYFTYEFSYVLANGYIPIHFILFMISGFLIYWLIREKYIEGNLRLVLSIIKRFENRNENMDDLFQIGVVGLIKAIDNFDISLNLQFSTYAVPMIIGEIRRYMRDNSSIRVSRSLRDTAYKAVYAKERYMKKYLREPTIQEIAEEIGCLFIFHSNSCISSSIIFISRLHSSILLSFSCLTCCLVAYIASSSLSKMPQ